MLRYFSAFVADNNHNFISMRLQKITSFSSGQHSEPPRLASPGLLTRKPQKKAPFARKKAIECSQPQPKYSPFASRLSREKRSPKQDTLSNCSSLKIINVNLAEDIKYLSPKHAQSSLTIAHTARELPVFRRKSQIQPTRCLLQSPKENFFGFDDLVINDDTPTPSGISIQSLASKSYAVETAEHSADWFGLQGENEKLKEENHRLQEENHRLEEEVSNLQRELEQQPFSKKCPKCRHYDALERLKDQSAQQERTINAYKNQIEMMKKKIAQSQLDLKEQRKTIVLLSKELDASRQAEEQMDALVCNLKEKIESDTLQLRYLNIQQDVLRRRKEEYERNRLQGLRKDIQRDSMRRVLNQYKEKIELLRKVIAKGRKDKRIMSRNEEVEISLELSMDSIL